MSDKASLTHPQDNHQQPLPQRDIFTTIQDSHIQRRLYLHQLSDQIITEEETPVDSEEEETPMNLDEDMTHNEEVPVPVPKSSLQKHYISLKRTEQIRRYNKVLMKEDRAQRAKERERVRQRSRESEIEPDTDDGLQYSSKRVRFD